MTPIVLVPARLGATRLPGKPLALIAGEPMIVHVWRRATEAVARAGGQAVMTRVDHPSGTDRIAEALAVLDPGGLHDVVVNLQGDLPTLAPGVCRQVAAVLEDPAVALATAVAPVADPAEGRSPDVVKMVGTPVGPGRFRALYFTRAEAPWGDGPRYHHIGLYGWRRAELERFVALPPSALERRERLEQLRALEAGLRVDAVLVDGVPLGVDTPADLARARLALGGVAGRPGAPPPGSDA